MQEKGFPALGTGRQSDTPLIPSLERGLRVQISTIDGLHQEFADMVNAMEHAERAEFARLFHQLVTHTENHFAYENGLMEETRFPGRNEHQAEHRRVLGELSQLNSRLREGEMEPVRSYVCERLPRWFRLHVITMDHALARHLQG
jgi:hemerythrin-like metal-binding protein